MPLMINAARTGATKAFGQEGGPRKISPVEDDWIDGKPTAMKEVTTSDGSICLVSKTNALPVSTSRSARAFSKKDPKTGEYRAMAAYAIHPDSFFMKSWNAAMVFFVMLCVLYVPYAMAFDYVASIDGTVNRS